MQKDQGAGEELPELDCVAPQPEKKCSDARRAVGGDEGLPWDALSRSPCSRTRVENEGHLHEVIRGQKYSGRYDAAVMSCSGAAGGSSSSHMIIVFELKKPRPEKLPEAQNIRQAETVLILAQRATRRG